MLVLVGTPIAVGRGYEFEVNMLGKAATWLLYAALGFVMVTHEGDAVAALDLLGRPRARALVALGVYALKARREVLA